MFKFFKKQEVDLTNKELLSSIEAKLAVNREAIRADISSIEEMVTSYKEETANSISIGITLIKETVDSLRDELASFNISTVDAIESSKEALSTLNTNLIQTIISQKNVSDDEFFREQMSLVANSLLELRKEIATVATNLNSELDKIKLDLESKVITDTVVNNIIGTINNSNNKRSETILNGLNELKNKSISADETIAASIGFLINKIDPTEGVTVSSGTLAPSERKQKRRGNHR